MCFITPLDAMHRRAGARMVAFAGFWLPVQYPGGVIAEHLHCRAAAALFDVSHMGQAMLSGPGAGAYLETRLPGDITGLVPGRQRYSFFTTADGGLSDDLMVARLGPERFFLVVNASRKAADFELLAADLPPGVEFSVLADRALLALQGPAAAAMLPQLAGLDFLAVAEAELHGVDCIVSRSGYTGEDGFEISCPAARACDLAARLLDDPRCRAAGLGARDSLRLEAGLCLYGADLDADTNPIEAGLGWAIGKRRLAAGDFPGAAAIRAVMRTGPARVRVGLLPEGRAPVRAGCAIMDRDGARIGTVTSGSYSPTLGRPIAMGYVRPGEAMEGCAVQVALRGKALAARVAKLPFVAHRYRR